MNKVKYAIMKRRIEREIKRISKELEEARKNQRQDDLVILDLDEIFSDDEVLDLPEDDDGEEEEVSELAEAIASFAAERAADNFTDAVNGMRVNVIAEMIRMIGHGDSVSGVRMLKGMLYARGMKDAAKELDIIEMCEGCCEDICNMFIADFMHNEEISHIMVRDVLREVS